jgi:hypothetical protein
LAAYLNPFATNPIFVNSATTLSDTTAGAWNALSGLGGVTAPLSSSNCAVFRVVSAWLGITDLTAALTKTGYCCFGNASYKQITGTLASSDTLRDQPYAQTRMSQAMKEYCGGFYLPVDPQSMFFFNIGAQPNDFDMPVLFFSAGTSTASLSLQYHINYEYVPLAGQTDLLETAPTPAGRLEGSLLKAGEVRNEAGAGSQVGGKADNLIKDVLKTAAQVDEMVGGFKNAGSRMTDFSSKIGLDAMNVKFPGNKYL